MTAQSNQNPAPVIGLSCCCTYNAPMAANLLSIWIPIIVAVIALVYSIRSDRRGHRHNRLSVKPILNVCNHIQNQPSEFTATLVNNGTGPAIITDVVFFSTASQ